MNNHRVEDHLRVAAAWRFSSHADPSPALIVVAERLNTAAPADTGQVLDKPAFSTGGSDS